MREEQPEYQTISKFDKTVGGLLNGNNLHTKPTTIEDVSTVQGARTFIVQTVRDEKGDHVIVKYLDNDGPVRIVLPPRVSQAIQRQKDSLTSRARSNSSKAVARKRMQSGELPGFMRKKKAGGQ